jgi:hypothetical protein
MYAPPGLYLTLHDSQSQCLGWQEWVEERTASKGILVRRARMVCYLDTTRLPYGVVVEVDIGALVEAMVGWFP